MWGILVLVFIILLILVSKRPWLTRRQLALAKKLKSKIKAYPILGHSYKFFWTDKDRMTAWKDFGRDAIEAGGISKIFHFDQLLICVADPVVAEVVLYQCLEKHNILKIADLVVGNSSNIAPVPIWRHRRNICEPTFNSKNLIQYVQTFSERSIALTDVLEEKVDKGTFSLWDYIVVCGMNTVCETTLGVKTNFQGSEFLKAAEELWQIAASIVMCKPWLGIKYLMPLMPSYRTILKHKRTISNFITEVTAEKCKIQENVNHADFKFIKGSCESFLDLQLKTLENSENLSEEEIAEEAWLLMAAGYGTSATNIGFVVLMLSRHADVQDKVYRELQEVFGDSDRAVSYEDLSRLKYLEAAIKETLRLYPAIPVVARQVDNDVQLLPDITAVKDCGVIVNIWAIHRNPLYWGADADQFRPERFLDSSLTHPAAFLPFGVGARSCIGNRYVMLQNKTTLSTLLRRYRVLAPPGVPQGAPLRTKYEIIMRDAGNYEIRLERRK